MLCCCCCCCCWHCCWHCRAGGAWSSGSAQVCEGKREGRSSNAPDAPIMHATYCLETLVVAAALMCPAMPIKPTLTANGCCGRHETVVEDGGRIVWGAAAGAMRAAPNRSMPPPNPHRHQSKVARSWATVALAQQGGRLSRRSCFPF